MGELCLGVRSKGVDEMEKAEIEGMVSSRIRAAVEEAVSKAIRDLNTAGHRFEPIEETFFEWVEPSADESLQVTCAIGVGFAAQTKAGRHADPRVESFISKAESGADQEATLLNLLEGDISNGGFLQLYENKGDRFIQKGIALLRKIGSRSTLRLVEQALEVIRDERATLKSYELLRKKLDRLDSRFCSLKENIPALFERYCQGERSRVSTKLNRARTR